MEENIARIIYVFGELTKMEVALSTAITKSKIPAGEIKIMLRSTNPLQVERTPLFQYMKTVFREIGLGNLKCLEISPFQMTFGIRNSKVAKLFSDVKGKTCYLTADAFAMFFEKDMDISCHVKETECVNNGDEMCKFVVDMDPLGVLKYVIDNIDIEILNSLKKGKNIQVEDYEARMFNLQRYGLVEKNKLTIMGEKYLEIKRSPLIETERPWKRLSEVSEVTASAKSFAEAFSKTVGEEEVEEIDESKIVNIVDEANKSRSFAELLAKYVKKEVKEDE